MILQKGSVNYYGHKDIYYQRSFVEDENKNILCKLVICATDEYLKQKNILQSNKTEEWFNEKTEKLFENYKKRTDRKEIDRLIEIYPQLQTLYDFADQI